MRFTLIDKIVELVPGDQITATKNVTMAEEYLAGHFPRFPVMPGVLMLEAMTQTCAWLLRVTDDFAHSVVVLKEAKNVKYSQFVAPGQTLSVTAKLKKRVENDAVFAVQGAVGDVQRVSARLVLTGYNLTEQDSTAELSDRQVRHELRKLLALLWSGAKAPLDHEAMATGK